MAGQHIAVATDQCFDISFHLHRRKDPLETVSPQARLVRTTILIFLSYMTSSNRDEYSTEFGGEALVEGSKVWSAELDHKQYNGDETREGGRDDPRQRRVTPQNGCFSGCEERFRHFVLLMITRTGWLEFRRHLGPIA